MSFFFIPAFHEVSVYPKKELPFFILFTAGLCSFCAMLAMLTHQFPELMGVFVKAVSICTPQQTQKCFVFAFTLVPLCPLIFIYLFFCVEEKDTITELPR